MNKYQYEELRAAALAPGAASEDVAALGEWFEQYGMDFWNGEYFDVDGYCLYRVEEYDEENDVSTVVGYEIR